MNILFFLTWFFHLLLTFFPLADYLILMNFLLIFYLSLIFKKLCILSWSHLGWRDHLFIGFICYRLFLSSSLKLLNVNLLKISLLLQVHLLFHCLNLILISLRIENLLWGLGLLTLGTEYSIHCSFPLFLCAQNLVFWWY